MQSAHKDFILAPRASGRVSWWETCLLSLLALGFGYWLSPDDPLLVVASFPWMILVPILLGVRYGFLQGLFSAALLIAALFVFRLSGWELYLDIPASFIVGMLLCSMLVGEFRDIWERSGGKTPRGSATMAAVEVPETAQAAAAGAIRRGSRTWIAPSAPRAGSASRSPARWPPRGPPWSPWTCPRPGTP